MLQTTLLSDSTLLAAGAVQDLPPGGRKLVFAPGGETILLLNVEGEFYAMENSCPHAGASLASGACDAHVLTCPCAWAQVQHQEWAVHSIAANDDSSVRGSGARGRLWLKRPETVM